MVRTMITMVSMTNIMRLVILNMMMLMVMMMRTVMVPLMIMVMMVMMMRVMMMVVVWVMMTMVVRSMVVMWSMVVRLFLPLHHLCSKHVLRTSMPLPVQIVVEECETERGPLWAAPLYNRNMHFCAASAPIQAVRALRGHWLRGATH